MLLKAPGFRKANLNARPVISTHPSIKKRSGEALQGTPESLVAIDRVNSGSIDSGGPRINIESGYRDPNKLVHLYTTREGVAPGAPVGLNSHHTWTGTAYDINNWKAVKPLLLKNGFVQPLPKNDPNHWEYRPSAEQKASAKVALSGGTAVKSVDSAAELFQSRVQGKMFWMPNMQSLGTGATLVQRTPGGGIERVNDTQGVPIIIDFDELLEGRN